MTDGPTHQYKSSHCPCNDGYRSPGDYEIPLGLCGQKKPLQKAAEAERYFFTGEFFSGDALALLLVQVSPEATMGDTKLLEAVVLPEPGQRYRRCPAENAADHSRMQVAPLDTPDTWTRSGTPARKSPRTCSNRVVSSTESAFHLPRSTDNRKKSANSQAHLNDVERNHGDSLDVTEACEAAVEKNAVAGAGGN
jgi:hypothetical protein